MTQLTKFFSDLSFGEPAIWLAIGSGLIILLVFLLLGRRKRRHVPIVGLNDDPDLNPADAWLPPSRRPDERRRSIRRTGVPTAIKLADPKKPKKFIEGFVLDRSSGGVRLASQKPFPSGSTLQIRPSNAPADVPWVIIIVRSCRETGDFFELGCQFHEELPWNMLLMFG